MGTCFSTSVNTSASSASNSRSLGSGYPTTTTSRTATSGSIASSSTVGSSSYSIETTGESSNGQVILSPILKVFTLAELRAATRNFKPDTLLGEGGFGKVYKAWVDEKTLTPTKSGLGIVVAVKKLTPDSMQGIEEWKSEVDFLGKLSHPNLVKLLGYCIEDRDLLLVYEFMAKGSLENHLFRKSNQQPLSWDLRLRIATDAAKGLAFLHSSNSSIIYRDFKASNILLDSDFNAKLSDFGLAKNGPTGEKSHLTTRIMGTYGYAAPEYVATGHLYVQSDVYGFGVVLLEMLSGLRAHDLNRPTGQKNLVDWAKPLLTDKKKITTRLMDSSLDKQYTPKASYLAAQLVLKCIASKPKERPSMDEVVKSLGDIMMQTKDARPPPALHTSRTCSKQAAVRKRQAYPLPNSR